MLRRSMNSAQLLHLALDDLLAELRHARRTGDMGRMALIVWCELRPWARRAGEVEVAERVAAIMVHSPHASRADFQRDVDTLIELLSRVLQRWQGTGLGQPTLSGRATGPGPT